MPVPSFGTLPGASLWVEFAEALLRAMARGEECASCRWGLLPGRILSRRKLQRRGLDV